jgi:tetratricopeptide (TPR) repeat protein
MGVFHYYDFREYEPALTEFQRALALRANNLPALQYVAAVHRRQDRWNSSLDELRRSLDQDPLDSNIASTIRDPGFQQLLTTPARIGP